MKQYLARFLRKQANRLDPPAKPQSWIYEPTKVTTTNGASVTYTVLP